MVDAPDSSSTNNRVPALHHYRALSSAPSPALDGLVRLAAILCDVPMAFVSFFDGEYQVIKASVGCNHSRIPLDWMLGRETLNEGRLCIIEDVKADPELAQHPFLKLVSDLRFYAAVPILTPEFLGIGTLAVLDVQPCTLTPDQKDGLLTLGSLVLTHLNEQGYLQEFRQIQRQQEKNDVELRRHALIFAHIHDALLVLDLGGRIIDCNPGASDLFGWAKAELFGRTIQCLHPPSYSTHSLNIVKAILSDKTWKMETPFLRKNGTMGTAQIHAVPLQSRGKQIIGILVIYHDITDRRLVELAWEEQKLALQAAERAAQDANRAKGEFLAMMSHEIRTPMNAVIGMTEILQETPLSPEQRDFVETIHTAGEALLTIVNQVLDLSKLESGNFQLETYTFELQECVETALDLLAAKALEKKLGLFYSIEDHVPLRVAGDGNRLRQILINLISNALKFTEVGEVRVKVSRVHRPNRDPSEPVMIQFAVQDTGIGISPEKQATIFQPYSQAEVSTARRYGGTGLGLSICLYLVELMGGELWVTSELGKGSTFCFTAQLQPLDTMPEDASLRVLRGKHLLILEDNPELQRSLSYQVQQWGMIPSVVGSVTEALNHLRHGDSVNVVMINWLLGQDSFALATQMHQLSRYGQLPIFLVVGVEQEKSATFIDRWKNQTEFVGKLCKPIKYKTLKKLLVQVCQPYPYSAVSVSPSLYDRTLGEQFPLRILLAEDDRVNQKVIDQILQRLGYMPQIANNGREVLTQLENSSFDLILLDLNMPELNGWDTAREITQRYGGADRPRLVALTAHTLSTVEQQCEALSMSYLMKPIRLPDLIHILQNTPRLPMN